MNTKKIAKNSGKKQTIHIDKLLNDKQNYQSCQNFSVDEKLKAKLSNIPYSQVQAQQYTQQKDYITSDNKKSWLDWFQFLFQPRYAMLSLVVLIIGVFWFFGKQWIYPDYNIKTPGSLTISLLDPGVTPEAVTENKKLEDISSPAPMIMSYRSRSANIPDDNNNTSDNSNMMFDAQPVMMEEEYCNDCDSVYKEKNIETQKNKEKLKKVKEKNFSSVLFYVSIYLLFSL